MALAERRGLPLSATIASDERHEVRRAALNASFTNAAPRRLICDRAYECAKLAADLADQGIELTSPAQRDGSARWPNGRSSFATNLNQRLNACSHASAAEFYESTTYNEIATSTLLACP